MQRRNFLFSSSKILFETQKRNIIALSAYAIDASSL